MVPLRKKVLKYGSPKPSHQGPEVSGLLRTRKAAGLSALSSEGSYVWVEPRGFRV